MRYSSLKIAFIFFQKIIGSRLFFLIPYLLLTLANLSFAQELWLPIGKGLGNNASVSSIFEKEDIIYVGGYSFRINRLPQENDAFIATNNYQWALPSPMSLESPSASIYAIDEYQGNIVVGGSFNNIDGDETLANIAIWDGLKWQSLDQGLNNEVYSIFVDGDDLYAGGRFRNAGNIENANWIAKWDGSQWSALGEGLDG
ncbi:MAG: hypothetical protein AAFO07_27470 [Bacteroidota bacterium]